MQLCEMILSQVIHYLHVSGAVAVIIKVVYKVTGSPKGLLQCLCEQLTLTAHVSDFLLCYWTSAV